ncbi:MAG: 50S ribosomal protein L30 [Terriglobia bacterium]
MADKTLKMIRIKWVRSGIGFTHHQKTIVRSLGLNKLNHTVVRPDTPQIRGIVAAVPHLLKIVPEAPAPAWALIPEYTVHAPVAAPPAPAEASPVPATEAVGEAAVVAETTEEKTVEAKADAPAVKRAKAVRKKKSSPAKSKPAKKSKK